MSVFSQTQISLIDRMWRELCDDHPWTGWAFIEEQGDEIWLFRKQANWRRFVLTRSSAGFRLVDESGDNARQFKDIAALPDAVAAMPTLAEHAGRPS